MLAFPLKREGAGIRSSSKGSIEACERRARASSFGPAALAAAPLIPKDAVQFYDGVVRKPDNKQQIKGNCMACGKSVSSTASTRMLEHLVKCPLVPTEIIKGRTLKESSSCRATRPAGSAKQKESCRTVEARPQPQTTMPIGQKDCAASKNKGFVPGV